MRSVLAVLLALGCSQAPPPTPPPSPAPPPAQQPRQAEFAQPPAEQPPDAPPPAPQSPDDGNKEPWRSTADRPDCGTCTGPRMGMPNWQCEDGRRGGPVCKLLDSGVCKYVVVRCPAAQPGATPNVGAAQLRVHVELESGVCGGVAGTPCRTSKRPLKGFSIRLLRTAPDASPALERSTDDSGTASFTVAPGHFRVELAQAMPSRPGYATSVYVTEPVVQLKAGQTREVRVHIRQVGQAPSTPPGAGIREGQRCQSLRARHGDLVCTAGCPFGPATWRRNPKPCRNRCLAPGTMIATPRGDVSIEKLRVGDWVLSWNVGGQPITAPIVGRQTVPATARIPEIALDDGRRVRVSREHPTADGRLIGELEIGDMLDGARVVSVGMVANTARVTYDIALAHGGPYRANGVRLGSTMAPGRSTAIPGGGPTPSN